MSPAGILWAMAHPPRKFVKTTHALPSGHAWQCKKGNNLFVADGGAVAFEIPAKWVVRHDGQNVVTIHDKAPPADEARLSLTIFHLPPVRDGWGKLPLADLMRQTFAAPADGSSEAGPPVATEIHVESRPDMDLVWTERPSWNDTDNGRPIRCRQVMARARLVQILLTFDVYEEAAGRFADAWADLLRSLRLAIPRDINGQIRN